MTSPLLGRFIAIVMLLGAITNPAMGGCWFSQGHFDIDSVTVAEHHSPCPAHRAAQLSHADDAEISRHCGQDCSCGADCSCAAAATGAPVSPDIPAILPLFNLPPTPVVVTARTTILAPDPRPPLSC